MLTDESKQVIAPILGRIPSGVFILVAGNESGQRTGLLASWIQQASFEPPQITVAVNKSRYLNEWLTVGAPITVNQIRSGDTSLFRHFGKGFDPGVDAFVGVDITTGTNGLPLLTNAMASMEGQVVSSMQAGDHVIYLVTVKSATAHQDASDFDPFVHVRRNGFSY